MLEWLRRLLGNRSGEDPAALGFQVEDCWEVSPTEDGALFLRALPLIVDAGGVVYFEGSRSRAVSETLARLSVPPEAVVPKSIIWPRPDRYHLRTSPAVLEELALFLESQPDPRPSYHCHVYESGVLVLVWHDAFADPIYVAGAVSEAGVRAFGEAIGATAARRAG